MSNQELQLKIDEYGDMLFKICFLRLKNRQDAEDAVQETLYRYWKQAGGFESAEHEKAWLIKVAINVCRKVWRSAWYKHRSQEEADAAAEKIADVASELPDEQMVQAEERLQIMQAVMELPLKYRDVIHLFYYEQLSVKEIAEVTGRKVATVTSQLSRGREMLRKSLKEGYDFA